MSQYKKPEVTEVTNKSARVVQKQTNCSGSN